MAKYFGTDGIRGRFGVEPLSVDFILRIGNAVGKSLLKKGDSVVIGRDTRISGDVIESAVAAGLQAAGINVQLAGIVPTPAVAYLVTKYKADLGIVVSASHNPYADNGLKFFNAKGGKLTDAEQFAIEEQVDTDIITLQSDELGTSFTLLAPQNEYVDFVLNTVPGLSLDDMKVVVDAGHGAMFKVAPRAIEELGAEMNTIGTAPNGTNINEECGSTHTKNLQTAVKDFSANIGLSFDGDGDRLVVVDHLGETVDGDELLYILAKHSHQQKPLSGPVVGTSMTNMGLEVAFQELGIDFVRARVGDKHVLEKLAETGGKFGGETSGHLICLDHATTGDGLTAAVQILKILKESRITLNRLKKGFNKYPQLIVNVKVNEKEKAISHPKTQAALVACQKQLGTTGRIVLRPSGTEPVIRVMVESENAGLTSKLANEIADTISVLGY